MSRSNPEPDFEWLLSARADIQRDLLDLHNLVTLRRDALMQGDDDRLRSTFGLLVGAGFSLWRAAFQSDIARGWPDILNRADELLRELLVTNAALFTFERTVRDWTFGYYLNNALQRLAEVRQKLGDENLTDTLTRFDDLHRHGLIGLTIKPTESWSIGQAALRELVHTLRERLDAHSS
jgi:hypothetical protein